MTHGLTRPDRADLEDLFDLDDIEDREMLCELYEHFLDEGLTQIRQLAAMMESGNLQEVDEIAHKLKSTFGNVGLGGSAAICDQIMVEARGGEAGPAKAHVDHLGSLIPDLETGVREFMGTL